MLETDQDIDIGRLRHTKRKNMIKLRSQEEEILSVSELSKEEDMRVMDQTLKEQTT